MNLPKLSSASLILFNAPVIVGFCLFIFISSFTALVMIFESSLSSFLTLPKERKICSAVCNAISSSFFKNMRGSKLPLRSEEHTSELQSRFELVCRLLLEKKKRRRAAAQHQSQY